MTRSKPPVLVVGSGFGCRIHVPALRAAGFEVLGLVGTDAARTQRRADARGIPQAFTDLDAAITRTGATLVTVATPPPTHAALSMLALSRGCHVLCEKPFAQDATEARRMLAAAERASVLHLVGHEFRWKPERALLARAVAEGLIGEPRFATFLQYVSLVASPEARMPRWWFDAQAGGGWLGASGSHIVDQVRSTLGEFVSLSAALPTVAARAGVAEDSYVVRFRLVNGIEGVLQQSGGAWGPFAGMTRVAGTQGTAWIESDTVKIADRNGTRDLPMPSDLVLPAPPPPAGNDPWHEYSVVELGPYTRLFEALRGMMEGKRESAVPVPTFSDGVAEMEVLDAIRKSAASHGELVTLDRGRDS
ncbi:MAG TPA: Gfo/Idh/MocA family oxidoreductase [Steroidobacteraceae bacterium]|nr:Gfo/Idh/MocA family oxidoreductase [Steroidobacteraceae bacterium]